MRLTGGEAKRVGLLASGVALGAAALSGVANVAIATYFARRVVTPEQRRPDDTTVLRFDEHTVTLRANINTVLPGRYGIWFGGDAGHARVGSILATSSAEVTRELLGVDLGEITEGPARWNGKYYAGTPATALGLQTEDLTLESDIGLLPTWLVRPAPEHAARGLWAILVHGRSASREETLRAIPVLHELGYHVLVPSYRNDPDAPASIDGRYTLGLFEWRDVDAALRHARAHSARQVLLAGWSMGGAIVLQTLDKSAHATCVTKVLLDGPVIDWADVLRHQARVKRIPRSIGRLARDILGTRAVHALAGIAEPLDLRVANWVDRAAELRHPTLIIHSDDDDVVPSGPSRELARRRPDVVTFVPWGVAQHTREWNVDPERWERVVREFARP